MFHLYDGYHFIGMHLLWWCSGLPSYRSYSECSNRFPGTEDVRVFGGNAALRPPPFSQ